MLCCPRAVIYTGDCCNSVILVRIVLVNFRAAWGQPISLSVLAALLAGSRVRVMNSI
eukprot:Gb_38791 [translate_table: standard]